MIERYFVKGARFRWNAPGAIPNQPKDGAIVVNPPVPPATMTYVGLDGEIVDLGLPHVSTFGLTMNMPIPYSWLCYILGRTAKIASGNDVLTGFMSGCWIATWMDAGQRWVGHIGTVESAGPNDPPNSTVKINFTTTMPRDVQGYNPIGNPVLVWSADEINGIISKCKERPTAKILSLVTATGGFYSILFCSRVMSEPGIWVSGGCKSVPAVGYDGIADALVATRPRR